MLYWWEETEEDVWTFPCIKNKLPTKGEKGDKRLSIHNFESLKTVEYFLKRMEEKD